MSSIGITDYNKNTLIMYHLTGSVQLSEKARLPTQTVWTSDGRSVHHLRHRQLCPPPPSYLLSSESPPDRAVLPAFPLLKRDTSTLFPKDITPCPPERAEGIWLREQTNLDSALRRVILQEYTKEINGRAHPYYVLHV